MNPTDKRRKNIMVRVRDVDYEKIKAAAAKAGVTPAEWVREQAVRSCRY
jgi:predicted DNA binding CopG/RHH family protein